MRLLFLNDYADPAAGGASLVAIGQAEAMAARGHEVHFFSAVPGPHVERRGVRYAHCDQHDLLKHPQRIRAAVQGIWNVGAARRLSQHLDAIGAEGLVCHLHSWSKSLSSSIVAAVRARGVPLVCTLHDSFAACPNGGFFDYQRGRPCALRPMSARCVATNCDSRNYGHKLWRVGRQWVQSHVGGIPGDVDRLIVVSELSRRLLAPHLPAQVPMTVLPTPIAIERRPPRPAAERHDAVFVGRLAPEKGVHIYAHACARIGIEPSVLGDGELADVLRAICPGARISGWLATVELRHRLAGARVLVFPTRAYEAQPLSVLEAAALGVPTIVSAHCAAADWVGQSGGGVLLESDQPEEWALHMRRLLDNADEADRLGGKAYDWFWASPFADVEALNARLEAEYSAASRQEKTTSAD